MNFKDLSLSAVIVLALGASFAAACGGSVDITFVGADSGAGGDDGNDGCGDGDVASDEECDDENTAAGDGCDAACAIESGFSCTDEPSECARTVGNGDVDPGETCDDGNVEAGDGCSDTGQIEGSCDAPVVIALAPNEDGVLVGRAESSTSGGGSVLDAAACSGDDAGGGPDRIFQIELNRAADLRLRVESTFNPIIRLLNEPCDLDSERVCSNDAGVGAVEDLVVNKLPAGTYYVAVDGAQSGQQGDFTLRVDGLCPLESLALTSANFNRSRVDITNRSTACSVPLSGATLGIEYDTGSPFSSVYELPDVLLAPGETFTAANYVPSGLDNHLLSSPSPYPNAISGGFYLCRGSCNLATGGNVIDAFVNGNQPPTLPSGITFDSPLYVFPDWYDPDYYPREFAYYQRAGYDGSFPDFLAADWRATFRVDTRWNDFNYLSTTGTVGYDYVDDEDEGRILRLTMTSSSITGYNIPIPPGLQTPTYFRYRYRRNVGAATEISCYALLGSAVGSYDGVFLFAYGNAAQVSLGSNINIGTFDYGDWVTIELRDINWAEQHADTYFNGDLVYTDQALRGATSVSSLLIGGATANQDCDYAEVVMY